MATAKVFMSGRSQAVRLPKEFRINGSEVTIERVGESIVLTPVHANWNQFFAALRAFGPDVQIEREQPQVQQVREALDDE